MRGDSTHRETFTRRPAMASDKDGDKAGAKNEAQQVLKRIGDRLRQLRRERGMSLARVAEAAGLTRSFLSQLELGDTSASVSSLYRICAALGIEITILFEAPSSSLVRREDRVVTALGGHGEIDHLLTPASERRVQLIETHIEPGGTADEELWTRTGDIAIAYVLEGVLELRFQTDTLLLEQGDTITFDPGIPHTWSNPSARTRTEVLFVSVPAAY